MGVSKEVRLTGRKKCTYAGHVTRAEVNDTEVAKARLGEDNAGDHKHGTGNKSTESIREDVLKHNSAVVSTESSSYENVFLILESVELHSRPSCSACPASQEE